VRGVPIPMSAIVGAARSKPSNDFNESAAAFCAIAGPRIWTIDSTPLSTPRNALHAPTPVVGPTTKTGNREDPNFGLAKRQKHDGVRKLVEEGSMKRRTVDA
jgi:hypothetical protein